MVRNRHDGLSHEGTTGRCTARYSDFHSVDPVNYFFADYGTALQLGQTGGEVCLEYKKASNDIRYIVRAWNGSQVIASGATATAGHYTRISEATANLAGTYVVQGNITLSHPLLVMGNTDIILCDGSSLTVPGILLGLNGLTLSIYGQINDSGRINTTASSGNTGIGTGSRDKDWGILTSIDIFGGYINAVGGEDAADRGCAFGSEDGVSRKGDIIFADKMCVIAGNSKHTATIFSEPERKGACWYRPYARVEVCTHPDHDSTNCPYCKH